MKANRTYSNAVRTLQPSRAEMDRRLAPAREIHTQAIAYLRALRLTQEGAVALWECMEANRPNETELGKAIRLVLFGYRRGTSKIGGPRDPINRD